MKRILLFIAFCLSFASVHAQDMATLFTGMPDNYLPQLETAWRKDLVDIYHSEGKEARLQNMVNGFSELKMLTDNYLLLQTTEKSTMEMKLFTLVNNTPIICVVTTVYGPAPDSRVEFYSPDWQPLDAADIFTPVTAGWFISDNVDKHSAGYLDAMARLDMELVHYRLDAEKPTLTATYTTPLYLSEEDRKTVTPFLKSQPKVYTWEKFRFKD